MQIAIVLLYQSYLVYVTYNAILVLHIYQNEWVHVTCNVIMVLYQCELAHVA